MANAPRRGGGWLGMRLRPHQLAAAQALTSLSRHYRMSTGQGQRLCGPTVGNISPRTVVFVNPPCGRTHKCNHVARSIGKRSWAPFHHPPSPFPSPWGSTFSVLLCSLHVHVFSPPCDSICEFSPSERLRLCSRQSGLIKRHVGAFLESVTFGILNHLLSALNLG